MTLKVGARLADVEDLQQEMVRLQRRYGRARYSPPLADLSLEEQLHLHRLTVARHREFEALPERYQRLILEAEADLDRSRQGTEAVGLATAVS